MSADINLAQLREYPLVGVDVETTGKYWYRGDKMFGVAVAVHDGKDIHSRYWDIREKPRVLEAIKQELPHCKKVINHAAKFDVHMLLSAGVKVPLDRVECTMVRAGLINEHEIGGVDGGYSLDALCKKYIGEGKVDIWAELSKLFGGAPTRAVQIKNLHRAPVGLAAKYAAPDPALALKLWLWQEKEIEKQKLERVWGLEKSLFPVIVEIERQGVRVDVERTTKSQESMRELIDKAQVDLDRLVGRKVNVNSHPQMRVLFGCVKTEREVDGHKRIEWRTDSGYLLENTDADGPCMDKDAMMALAVKDPRAQKINEIRRFERGEQFLKNHILGHEVKGRVYPNYNQTKGESGKGTGTGRFSIDDPAMQQIPMHDRDVAEIVRPNFLPEVGDEWGCADWKQFEFRWFAHYTKDRAILSVYEEDENADFHKVTSDITGIPRDRKFAGDTANAKQINLGLVFGMGEGEMAYNMGMEYTQRTDKRGRVWKEAGPKAKEIFSKYHDAIPGVRALLQQASSIARARGWVETAMGRHIRFPNGQYHKAAGLVFQGTSADSMKLKMVELWPICQKLGIRMLLTVHDELDFSAPRSKITRATAAVKRSLETFDGKDCPIFCRVPIRTDLNWGANWWEACK